jgi:hypothetical protein
LEPPETPPFSAGSKYWLGEHGSPGGEVDWQAKSRLKQLRSRPMASAKGSPEICISTDAMKWSRVTNVVSTAVTVSWNVCGGGRKSLATVDDGGTGDDVHPDAPTGSPVPMARRASATGPPSMKTTFIIYNNKPISTQVAQRQTKTAICRGFRPLQESKRVLSGGVCRDAGGVS